jgi:hypothetical protein
MRSAGGNRPYLAAGIVAEFASPAPVAAENDSRLQPKESMIEGEFSRVEQSPEDVFVDGVILHRIANQVAHRS